MNAKKLTVMLAMSLTAGFATAAEVVVLEGPGAVMAAATPTQSVAQNADAAPLAALEGPAQFSAPVAANALTRQEVTAEMSNTGTPASERPVEGYASTMGLSNES